jgi:hypothetical protein
MGGYKCPDEAWRAHAGTPLCVLHYPAPYKHTSLFKRTLAARAAAGAAEFDFTGVHFPRDCHPFIHFSFGKTGDSRNALFLEAVFHGAAGPRGACGALRWN